MTARSRAYLKGISETGDSADQTLFTDLIDSFSLQENYSYALHVDLENGDDSNAGTDSEPFLTVAQAWIARLALGSSNTAIIYVHNMTSNPTSWTFDGTSGGSDSMFTFIVADYVASGKAWMPATINLVNAGYIQFAGTAFYNPSGAGLTIQTDTYVVSVHFQDYYVDGSLSVVGTPTKQATITLSGTFWIFKGFSGNGSNLRLITYSGAAIEFQGSGTFESIDLYNGSSQINSGQTLTASSTIDLFTGGLISLIGTATLAGGTLNEYGGLLSSSPTSTITITRSVSTRLYDYLSKRDTSEQLVAGPIEFSGQAYASNAAGTIKTFSATPTFNFNSGNVQEMPVTGNVTSFATSNEVGSGFYQVYLVNDGTAGRTVAAPTGWTKATDSSDHVTDANAVNLYQFFVRPAGSVKYYSIANLS